MKLKKEALTLIFIYDTLSTDETDENDGRAKQTNRFYNTVSHWVCGL